MSENKKILESFYQLIGEIGYNNFGIEQLAQISGADEENISKVYEDKEKLLIELIDYIYLKEKILIFKLDYKKPKKDELLNKGISFIKLNRYDKHYSAFKNQILLVALSNEEIKNKFEQIIDQYILQFKNIVEEIKLKYKIMGDSEYIAKEMYLLLDSLVLYENYKKNLDSELVWINYINRTIGEHI